jgi:SAM-dependent methyltransferase/predicted Ser/Thr protein kinase
MVGLFFPFVLIVSLHITLAKHYEYKSQEDNTILKAQTSCLETSMSTFTFRLHYPFQDNSSDLDLNILSSLATRSKLVGLAARCDWVFGNPETTTCGNEAGQCQAVFYGDIRKQPRTIFLTFDYLQNFMETIMPCLNSHFVVIVHLVPLGSFRYGISRSVYEQVTKFANSALVKHAFVQGDFFSDKKWDLHKKISMIPTGINSTAAYMNYIIDDIIYFPRVIKAPIISNRTLKVLVPNGVTENIPVNCNKSPQICEKKMVKIRSLKDYAELGTYSYVLCINENMVWQTLLAGAIPVLVMKESRFNKNGLDLPIVLIEFIENLNRLDIKTLKQIRKSLIPYFINVAKRQKIVEYMLVDYWWNQIHNTIHQIHSRPLQHYSGTSHVYIDFKNEFVIKIGKRFNAFTPISREICILKKLRNYDWCPKIISYGRNFIVTKWAGVPLRQYNIPKDFDSQIRRILHDLKEAGVQHNDITKRKNEIDMLVNEKRHLMLVDFGWATVSYNSSLRSYSCSDVGVERVSNFAPSWFLPTEDRHVISVLRTLAKGGSISRYMDPHRNTGSQSEIPQLLLSSNSLSVRGYQRFSLTTDGRLVIEKKKEKFHIILHVLKSLHETHKCSTFLDIGCNAGLTSFIAKRNGYSKRVIGLDHDYEYVEMYNRIVARENMLRIRAELFSFGDPLPLKYRSDVVFVGALIHWIYTCTAKFKNFANIFEYLYLVVGNILLIEWVDPLDSAILDFNHIESCGNQPSVNNTDHDDYTQKMFDRQLSIHFNVLDIIPLNKANTRLLYVTETKYHQMTKFNLQNGLSVPQADHIDIALTKTKNSVITDAIERAFCAAESFPFELPMVEKLFISDVQRVPGFLPIDILLPALNMKTIENKTHTQNDFSSQSLYLSFFNVSLCLSFKLQLQNQNIDYLKCIPFVKLNRRGWYNISIPLESPLNKIATGSSHTMTIKSFADTCYGRKSNTALKFSFSLPAIHGPQVCNSDLQRCFDNVSVFEKFLNNKISLRLVTTTFGCMFGFDVINTTPFQDNYNFQNIFLKVCIVKREIGNDEYFRSCSDYLRIAEIVNQAVFSLEVPEGLPTLYLSSKDVEEYFDGELYAMVPLCTALTDQCRYVTHLLQRERVAVSPNWTVDRLFLALNGAVYAGNLTEIHFVLNEIIRNSACLENQEYNIGSFPNLNAESSPLVIAAFNGNFDAVQMLYLVRKIYNPYLHNCIDPLSFDRHGLTPLDVALEKKHDNIAIYLAHEYHARFHISNSISSIYKYRRVFCSAFKKIAMYDRKFVLNNLLSTLQWEGGILAELVHMSAASGNVKMLKSALKYAKSEKHPDGHIVSFNTMHGTNG